MVADPSATSITDIAKWLEQKQDIGQSVTLFTGARTGGLFRGPTLYSTAQRFSPRTFNTMSRIEQFGECCHVLHRENFSKSDIDRILIESLQGLEISEIDVYLSELIKSGIFDTIISTNIDGLLTRGLIKVGMKETQDFQMFIPQKGFIEDIFETCLKIPCLLVKVFGDLEAGEYDLIRNDFYLDTHEKLKTFLTSVLQNNVLMLGYDPFWDRAIDTVIPQEGRELWYVNEGQVESSILQVLHKRRGRYLIGGEGNYDHFIRTLHWYLMGEKSAHNSFGRQQQTSSFASINPPFLSLQQPSEQPQATLQPPLNSKHDHPPTLSLQEKEQRRKVFIVYSQKDKTHFKQLKTQLARYEREKLLDIWDDTKIRAGNNQYAEIQKALATTRIAILLISAHFLASGLITENILPTLLQTAEVGGAIILPVIISHCVFEDTSLQQFQPFNPSEPLADKKPNDRDKVWADLVRYVITLVKDA